MSHIRQFLAHIDGSFALVQVSGPSTSQTPGLRNATSGGSSVLAPFPLFPGWDSFDSEDEGSNSDVGGDCYRPIDVDGEAGGSRVDALDEAKDEDDMDIDDEEATKTKVDLVESESHERISAVYAAVWGIESAKASVVANSDFATFMHDILTCCRCRLWRAWTSIRSPSKRRRKGGRTERTWRPRVKTGRLI